MNQSFPDFRIWLPESHKFVTKESSLYYYRQLINDTLIDLPYTSELIFQRKSSFVDNQNLPIYEGDIVSILNDENLNVLRFGLAKRKIQNYTGLRVYQLDIEGFYFENILDKLPYFSLSEEFLGYSHLKHTKIVGNVLESPNS